MSDVIFVDVFDSKVIDDKGEADGTPSVHPETWSELALVVSCNNQSFFEEFLCNNSCLGGSRHATVHFAELVPIVVDLVKEIEFFNDVLGEEADLHSELFVALHGCHQIEIFDVNGHKLGIFCGDNAVEE